VKLTIAPEARRAIESWLARDPSKPALRLSFAGGCGALGYRLTPSTADARTGETSVTVDGLTLHLDFKAASDLDGARIVLGDSEDDIVVLHHSGVVGGMC
jgi:Fe-S cluster assembly iron-binding protein IscA